MWGTELGFREVRIQKNLVSSKSPDTSWLMCWPPLILYEAMLSDWCIYISISLLEKALFRSVVRTGKRVGVLGFFFVGAGSHRICSSHFYVSNRLSAPGRFRLNKLPGEPMFVLEGSSNIQRPLWNLDQNTTPQRHGSSGHTAVNHLKKTFKKHSCFGKKSEETYEAFIYVIMIFWITHQ